MSECRNERNAAVRGILWKVEEKNAAGLDYASLCPGAQSDEEGVGAVEVDDVEAVVGVDFVLHAVDVVFYGLFGEGEVVGDFFVGEVLGEEGDELLFAAGEAETLARAAAGESSSFVLEIAEKRDAERAGADGGAGMDVADGVENFFGGGVAQEIAANACADALEKFGGVMAHPDEENEGLREAGAGLLDGGQVLLNATAGAQEENVGCESRGGFGWEGGDGIHGSNLDAGLLGEHARQGFAQEAIFGGEEDANFGLGLCGRDGCMRQRR